MLNLELMANIYPEELRKEAAHHRLVSLAQQRSMKKKHFLPRTLAWLGGRLHKWGHLLQERFGETEMVVPSKTMQSGLEA
jgi:hypothetical protein